jgi:hypothetical protein
MARIVGAIEEPGALRHRGDVAAALRLEPRQEPPTERSEGDV